MLRHGSLATAEQMVQYTYEPVEGDKVRTLDIIYPRYLVTVDIIYPIYLVTVDIIYYP